MKKPFGIRHRRLLILGVGLIAVVFSVLLVVGVVLFVLHYPELSPGGVSSTYNAVNGDWFLTRKARSAVPYMTAIERYRADHGAVPGKAKDLATYLSPGMITAGGTLGGWNYSTDNAGGYTLSLRLGWDPSLEYHWNSGIGTWSFSPGDGTPEKIIKLNP
jgi:hypothetical protein